MKATSIVIALAALGTLTACPDPGPENPQRLWLEAREGQMARLMPVEPEPY